MMYVNTLEMLRISGDTVEMADAGPQWQRHVVVNFLISQNIAVIKGKRYPPQYAEESDYKRGWYDLHFEATSQAYQGQEVNVEIWGAFGGYIKEIYESKRIEKEKFNDKHNICFLGIEFVDCYKLQSLVEFFKITFVTS